MSIKTPDDKWNVAQEYELNCWMNECSNSVGDRDEYYIEVFSQYAAIPGGTYSKTLEIGCGPFTKSRAVSNFAQLQKITLVDPLINKYTEHFGCSYRDKITHMVFELIESRGEDFCRPSEYDLGIMINVLMHCQDGDAVIDNLIASVKTGGILVIGEALHEEGYDGGPGHPLSPTKEWMEGKLDGIEPLYKVFGERKTAKGEHYQDMSFIGRKK
tara:strand:- start:3219 stop:3860 length:642 start_codon:yes stop_codon:yes gene_type:complete